MDLVSRSIRLRFVEEYDAEFILKLRLDDKYNKYLSAVSPDVSAQKVWIKEYKKNEEAGKEFYFIIEKLDGTPCGTVRVYDLRDGSFSWGSWILNEDKSRYAAIESAFLVYKFGFEELCFKKSHFEVIKGNDKVISFHKKMGALEIGDDKTNVYFEISDASVLVSKNKLSEKIL